MVVADVKTLRRLTMSQQDMLRKILEKLLAVPAGMLGMVYDLLKKMVDEPEEWAEAIKRFLRKENPWPEVVKTVSKLLVFVKEVELSAIGAFTPADKFKVTPEKVKKTADVIVGYVDPDLQAIFDGRGIEPARDAEMLRISRMAKASKFAPIIRELGDKAATTFGRVWQMIEKQGHGEEGDLLVNGYANLFFIEGTDWVLRCGWDSDDRCWDFYVCPVSFSLGWHAVHQWVSLADSL
ncbi:MAG: hypothetical protein NTW50_03255 [Candidatus Berkelbacteria bacterium]|nr:hypothetical protein [Candidatus Berkelbacteria bacterium]